MNRIAILMLTGMLLYSPGYAENTRQPAEFTPERTETMEINLTIGNTVLTATLNNNQASQDFISLLPLTLTLQDYAGTEKISDLPHKLSTAGAPSGSTPAAGDIAYYAPWGNLAIFYKGDRYASGLIILGKIEGQMEALRAPGNINVTIDLVK